MKNHVKIVARLARVPAPALAALGAMQGAAANETPDYFKDILPIFQQNCVACHREGALAPMALDSYEAARPWAKSILQAVKEQSMPPWLADPQIGHFSNALNLAPEHIDAIARWAAAGAPAGDPKLAPPPIQFPDWAIGAPDQVFTMQEGYTLAAEGPDEYKYFTVSEPFAEDKWVTALEVKPGNNRVVHHVIVFVQAPGAPDRGEGGNTKLNSFIPESPEAIAEAVKKGEAAQAALQAGSKTPRPLPMFGQVLGGVAPGTPPWVARPGEARLIKAGSKIYFQMHYHRNGKEEVDRTGVGVKFASGTVERERHTVGIGNMGFAVPPGAKDYVVESWHTFNQDAHALSFMPHMHLRGAAFEYRLEYPDGRVETLLSVPKYRFDWQYTYELAEPIAIPKGATIHCIAKFDNSADNPNNPDPRRVLRFGEPTEDEMMIGWMDVTLDEATPAKETQDAEKNVASTTGS